MTIASAAAAAIYGTSGYDQFDHIRGWLERLIKELEELDKESAEEMVDVHFVSDNSMVLAFFDGEAKHIHVNDTRAAYIALLKTAIENLDDIRLLVQTVIAAMPD